MFSRDLGQKNKNWLSICCEIHRFLSETCCQTLQTSTCQLHKKSPFSGCNFDFCSCPKGSHCSHCSSWQLSAEAIDWNNPKTLCIFNQWQFIIITIKWFIVKSKICENWPAVQFLLQTQMRQHTTRVTTNCC